MTLLQDSALAAALGNQELDKRLIVVPLLDKERQVGPSSIDLRLGTELLETRRRAGGEVNPFEESGADEREDTERFLMPLGRSFVLHPGQFVLGSTLEFLRMPPHLGGQVLGRSSWGRLGLIVATAVLVQPGFAGCLTLELVNMGPVPIHLYPGTRIAQLAVWTLEDVVGEPYGEGAKYKAPLGPQSSRLAWETSERDKILAIGKALEGPNIPR